LALAADDLPRATPAAEPFPKGRDVAALSQSHSPARVAVGGCVSPAAPVPYLDDHIEGRHQENDTHTANIRAIREIARSFEDAPYHRPYGVPEPVSQSVWEAPRPPIIRAAHGATTSSRPYRIEPTAADDDTVYDTSLSTQPAGGSSCCCWPWRSWSHVPAEAEPEDETFRL